MLCVRFCILQYSLEKVYVLLYSENKLSKVSLQIEYPSFHLNSESKSVLTQKSLLQIPINFNQHEIAAKTKHYLGRNALINQLLSTHILWICSLAPGQDSFLSQMINQNKLLFCAYFVGNLP